MKYIGASLYTNNGLETVQQQMNDLEADTCGFYVKNAVRYDCKPLSKETIKKFKKLVKNPAGFLIHGSLLLNLVNYKNNKSLEIMLDDLDKCDKLGLKIYNVHPGSDTLNLGIEAACKNVAEAINIGLKKHPSITILIETMAGQGHYIGKTFEELSKIIEQIDDKSRTGVTLDTCHIFCAGYDIRTHESFDKVMKDFKKIIGLKYLKGVHLNDSKKPFGSHKDRHESLGKGYIGEEGFDYLMNSPDFNSIPMILETPNQSIWKKELKFLRDLEKKK